MAAECPRVWFAVRTVIGTPWDHGERCYEERITLWISESFEEATTRAEAEAQTYAAQWDPPAEILALKQAYRLIDDPQDGAEIFSLIRDSALPSEEYLDRHFDTGTERQGLID